MTASPTLIGIGAGLVAAVLFASLANNSALALMLFYLTPLPVLLAGVGWGVSAALLAFVTATALLALVLSIKSAIAFGLFVGVPGVVLSYLMLLHRDVPVSGQPGEGSGSPQIRIEWYPFGRIIAWASVMAGGLVALALLLIGGDSETYSRTIGAIFNEEAFKQLQAVFGPEFGQAAFQQFVERFTRYILPAFAAIFWLLVMVGNLWLAAKSARISGLLARPLPEFTRIDYPLFVPIGFLIALALNFGSGLPGLIGTAFLGAFACAHLLMGLAVVHVLVATLQFKPLVLFALYAGLFLTPWVGLPVTLLGLLEPFLRLRQRHLQRNTPPTPPRPGPHL